MMKFKWLAAASAVLLWAALPGATLAQSTNSGDINGTVTDISGAAIPGASVTVQNVETGVSKTFLTNDSGVYDTSSIIAGTYKITLDRKSVV